VKKLLFLLPLMALASCSSGHDLMSNRTFSITCPWGWFEGDSFSAAINPELPQATFQFGEGMEPRIFSLTVVSPTTIRLAENVNPGNAIEIDRESGGVFWAYDRKPIEGCTFKSL